MKRKYRIIRVSERPWALQYKIEQRHTILFFFHWWGTPYFAPPHYFKTKWEAMDYIWEKNAYSEIINTDENENNQI